MLNIFQKSRASKRYPDWISYAFAISGLHSLLIIFTLPLGYVIGADWAFKLWLLLSTPGLWLAGLNSFSQSLVSQDFLFFSAGVSSIAVSFVVGSILGWIIEIKYFDQ